MNTIDWCDSAWRKLSLVNDEEVISLSHAKVYVFSDSVLCFGKMSENPLSNTVWEDKLTWFTSSSQCRTLDSTDGEPMECVWKIFPGFTTLQLWYKIQEFLSKMSMQSRDFTERIIFMSMFNDISWGLRKISKNANQALNSFRFMRKDFHPEDGHSSDFIQKRRGILLLNVNHKENGTGLQS